jgi:hypothetical protein
MVYIDPLIDYGWRLGPSCHLTADSIEELNKFAMSIGMKLSWFQEGKGSMPHYDLVASKRRLAVKYGAKELTRRGAGERYRNYRLSKKAPE